MGILIIGIIIAIGVVVWLFIPESFTADQAPQQNNQQSPEISGYENRLTLLKEELEYTKQSYQVAQRDLEDAQKKVELLESEVQKQTQWQQQQLAEIETLKKENGELKGQGALTGEIQEKEAKIIALEKANKDVCEELKSLKAQNDKYRKEIQATKNVQEPEKTTKTVPVESPASTEPAKAVRKKNKDSVEPPLQIVHVEPILLSQPREEFKQFPEQDR